ncbi:MAG: PilZ domain-containing protein [Pseudorhodoplanes sp.]|nr:PilZ domain-containing protein [Pseudorhodoplanes sp.]
MESPLQERRAHIRHKSFLQGRIYYNNRRATVDCIVRDINDHGARLKFSDSALVPDAFELYIPNRQETFKVHAIWNNGTEVGVAFEHAGIPSADTAGPALGAANLAERVARLEREIATIKRRMEALPVPE